jgi:hypothetical protein
MLLILLGDKIVKRKELPPDSALEGCFVILHDSEKNE